MILPSSYVVTAALIAIALICLGSWANLYKLTKGWRFELFYFDFAIAVGLTALVIGLTFGNMGFDGFTLIDDILHAGRRQEFFALVGGVLLNLGTMFLLAVVSIAGLSLAYPTVIGIGAALTVCISYALAPQGNLMLLFTGLGMLLVAVVFNLLGYHNYLSVKLIENIKSGKVKSLRTTVNLKAIVLSLVGGVMVGAAYPIIQMAAYRDVDNENGVGPYALALLVAMGVCFSAFVFNLFFMNVPVEGPVLEISAYFKSKFKQHLLGFAAGVIWCIGMEAGLVAATGQGAGKIAPQVVFGATRGSMVLGALWGVLAWKEFFDSDTRWKSYIWLTMLLLAVGTVMITIG
ncbi:MAG TPA: hypothetical protein DEQ47_16360 [Solibacterales bacterium]|nr:hypothetical protein [Bryobacterales bacterium]